MSLAKRLFRPLLSNRALALYEKYERTGRRDQLDAAVTLLREVVAATPARHHDLPMYLSNLGIVLWARFRQTSDLLDLDQAISAGNQALDVAPPGDADRPGYMLNLAAALTDRFETMGTIADLDQTILLLNDALQVLSPDDPDRAMLSSNLAVATRLRFESTADAADLAQSMLAGQNAVEGTSPEHPNRPKYLSNLALTFQTRFQQTGDLANLDQAIALMGEALRCSKEARASRATYHTNLGELLRLRSANTGNLSDLDNAIDQGHDAVAATPHQHSNRPMCLFSLSATFLARFRRTGEFSDVEKSIALGRSAVEATPRQHANRPLYTGNLAKVLLSQFEYANQLADLDQSIGLWRETIEATSAHHYNRSAHMSNLGVALHTRYESTGEPTDLDEAITLGRDALATAPNEHPDRPGYLSNLGIALRTRYERTGEPTDLDEAIALGRDAVEATPYEHPNKAMYLSNLGSTIGARHERTGEPIDLDEAIALSRDAVEATPYEHPNKAMYLSNLGSRMLARHERTGEPIDLDKAIALGRDAVDATPDEHPDKHGYLFNFGRALRTRYERGGDRTDLDQAIAQFLHAVTNLRPEHPNRSKCLLNLGNSLRLRFESDSRQTDLDDALSAYRDAAEVRTSPVVIRMAAAWTLGNVAMDAGQVTSAADAFDAAVGLLPLVAWHGLPRPTREYHLTNWSEIASDAAACAIHAKRPERAVELLELGRSILWAQTLGLRNDITDLAFADPDLAQRLDAIRTLLDTPPVADIPLMTADEIVHIDRKQSSQSQSIENRMRAAREFDDLVNLIRMRNGFEHFLSATPFSQLRMTASEGSVVIVNTSTYGSHALLLTPDGVRVVDLPNISRDETIDRANDFLDVLRRASERDKPPRDRERDQNTVIENLDWLWRAIASPILSNLRYLAPAKASAALPRVWWCLVGPLAFLPIHAAGIHNLPKRPDGPPTTVPDVVVSSYTPTLTALTRARRTSAPKERPTLLAIGMPTTPGQPDLPFVPIELNRIHSHQPITTRLQSPTREELFANVCTVGSQPNVATVLNELSRHSWLHLSCHGSQDPNDATASAFWLNDGPLSIANLIEKRDRRPGDLAFLSACQTASGSVGLPDESIHLASAMQLLGYRHIVATLWFVYDSPAVDVSDIFYSILATADADMAAHALHSAASTLRAELPAEPLAWAPYVHIGP